MPDIPWCKPPFCCWPPSTLGPLPPPPPAPPIFIGGGGPLFGILPQPKLALWTYGLFAPGGGGSGGRIYQISSAGGPADVAYDRGSLVEVGVGKWIGGPALGSMHTQFTPVAPGNATVATFYDQSPNNNDLTSESGPLVVDTGVACVNTATPVSRWSAVGQQLSRADALGLAPDPALTIAFAGSSTLGLVLGPLAPTIIEFGTQASPELVLFLGLQDLGGGNTQQFVGFTDEATANGAVWFLPANTDVFKDFFSLLLRKPAGTGYNGALWRLALNSSTLGSLISGPPDLQLGAGALVLGNQITSLGLNAGGLGPFPYVGDIAGCVVWEAELPDAESFQVLDFMVNGQ